MSGRTRVAAWLALLALIAPVQAQQSTGWERTGDRARKLMRGAGSASKRLLGFGGGIVVYELAQAALAGDRDGAVDAVVAPGAPEFLIQLLLFDRAMAGATAALHGSGRGASGTIPVVVADSIKHNMALAAAMAVSGAVEVDLNGASYADLVRLDPDALEGAQVRFHGVEVDHLAISLGAFGAATPLWTRAKVLGRGFGDLVAKRVVKTAAVKLGLSLAPAPGSRGAALATFVWDVGAAAIDTGALISLAHSLEAPVAALYAAETAEAHHRGAAELVASALRKPPRAEWVPRRARPTPKRPSLASALDSWRDSGTQLRNLAYEDVAWRDFALLKRLRRHGADRDALDDLALQAMGDYGPGLALVGQTWLLREAYGDGALGELVQRTAALQRDDLEAARAARAANYTDQLASLERWQGLAESDPDRELLRRAHAELDAERLADGLLFDGLLTEVVAVTPDGEGGAGGALGEALSGHLDGERSVGGAAQAPAAADPRPVAPQAGISETLRRLW